MFFHVYYTDWSRIDAHARGKLLPWKIKAALGSLGLPVNKLARSTWIGLTDRFVKALAGRIPAVTHILDSRGPSI